MVIENGNILLTIKPEGLGGNYGLGKAKRRQLLPYRKASGRLSKGDPEEKAFADVVTTRARSLQEAWAKEIADIVSPFKIRTVTGGTRPTRLLTRSGPICDLRKWIELLFVNL